MKTEVITIELRDTDLQTINGEFDVYVRGVLSGCCESLKAAEALAREISNRPSDYETTLDRIGGGK